MAESRPRSAFRRVRVPVALTVLVVTARLLGELLEIGLPWVTTHPAPTPAILSAMWLVPLFGFVFGWKLVGEKRGPERPGVALGLHLFALVILGGAYAIVALVAKPQYPIVLAAIGAPAVVALIFAWRAWPALLRVDLLYGLLVRLVIIVFTLIAVTAEWGTHFEAAPGWLGELARNDRLVLLGALQLVLWLPATAIVGGVFGSLAATIRS